MPFVEGGIVEDVVQQPTPSAGGFVQGGAVEDPTPEDSYQRVLQYQAGMLPDIPTKAEFLDFEAVSKKKPLLGERPLQTIGAAAVETGKMLATLPYRAGEAISETAIMPPEGVTRGQALGATGAEVAMQSRLSAEKLAGGIGETIMSKLDDLSQFLGGKARSEDDRYKAFLSLSDIKRTLALAQSGQVPAAQEVLQAYNIPQEAISPAGVEVGGFAAAPENIAFAGGGKIAGLLLSEAARALPTVAGAAQRTGAAIGQVARYPETAAGRAVAGMTGSEAAGAAVESAIGKGTTGIALGEAAGIPIAGTLNIPGIGGAARAIGTAKAFGAGLETAGEAGLAAQGVGLSPIERGLLGYGERIAAQEGGSRATRALGTAIARTGLETPIKTAAGILVPTVGAGVAGGALAGLAGEEGDQVASAIGSGLAFGGIEAGLRMQVAAAKEAFNGTRVRETALNDLNTRPNDVQFTYVNPVTKAEQIVTIADREARGEFYGKLDNKQLPKALSEIANAENAGIEVIFHKDGDPVPTDIQQIKYAGVSINPSSVRSGKPTILINVDRAKPETIPHEILHARITEDMVRRVGSQIVEGQVNEAQFRDFANKYADAISRSGDTVGADGIRNDLTTAFDPTLQRAQRIEALRRMSDEFTAYYTQEFLAGKDPKTVLPGRIPSFFEAAFNKAKEAVAERFSTRALQSGFDPIARTFYDANGKRVKVPWMEDAIKQLIVERKGYEPREEKFDTRKLTPNQQAALIAARGYQDLFVLNPDGSIGRPLTLSELKLKDVDIANRTIQLLDSLPQADRGTVTGMDAKGNPVINGRLSIAEADALARSGIFSASTSRYLSGIADAIQNGKLLNGTYWKVYGKTGKAGVFGESEKLFLPYAISVNRAGGVNIKVVDWGKVQSRMQTALQKQAYRNLFRSYDQAMNTLRDVYLKNIAEQNAVPSAEALGGGLDGAKKRNFFNEVMGAVPKKGDILINEPTAGYVAERKGGSVYQDLRIERLQNVEDTGFTLPWTGDMGEQSSYRRTQLNFQPDERIGETSTETDAKAGYRILSKQEKFRVYGPDGALLGIFDSAEQAKLKAEKDYATQTRLQPEIDQQQRVPRDEGRQTAEAGGGYRPLDRTQGGPESRQIDQAVRQAGDVRFMPEEEAAQKQVAEGLPRRAFFEAPGVSRDPNGNIYFNGKEPKDWTPKEFEEYGKAFGVSNLGPLSGIVDIPSDVAGNPARIPGGLEGKFTYYDLLWLKANPVDVANLPETTHAKLTAKLASTMAPTPGDKVSSFNSIVFGMLSPNAPLLPNEMGQARLRFGSMEEIKKFADLYPENPTPENLKKLNERLKRELGFISAGKGGLGIAITADISNIVNAARLFTKNPDFFVKRANESWADFVDKLTTQVRGFGTKTGSFGSVWQDPLKASISAMDRHMARIFGQELLANPELRKRFDGIVVDRFNAMLKKAKETTSAFNRRLKNAEEKAKRIEEINKNDEKTLKVLKAKNQKTIDKIKAEMSAALDSLPDPTATRAKTIDDVLAQAQIYGADRVQKFVNEAVFAAMGSRKATLLSRKGGINPNAPANIKSVEFIETPKDFQVMSDSYRSALEINERRAGELGVAVFPAQWTLWDRIRGRVEPHEVMFPGLDKLPALNDRQLGEAQKANKAAGYGSTPEPGQKWKRKQIDSPARLAYFMPAGEGEPKIYGDQPGQRGDRGGRVSSGGLAPLAGAPNVKGATGPDPGLVDVARSYASRAGIPHRRQAVYVEVDENLARRIANAYAEMKHAPLDPKVKEAYADMIRQTKDQYQALVDAGYQFTFFDSKNDPYAGNPSAAMRDLRANKRMAVYGTYDGYGTEGITGAAIQDNPMLALTGLKWPDQQGVLHDVTANDLFRAVHDAFGHGLEGAGFRARGEENAWQAHIRLFTGPARGAVTSETRGQNSWLNFGPYGERNRTAKLEDTVFADQKTGLMPEWTWSEGIAADEPLSTSPEGARYMPSDADYLSAVKAGDTAKAQQMVDEAAKAAGYTVGPVYHGTGAEFTSFDTEKTGGRGFYFSKNKQLAEQYSRGQKPNIVSAYLKLSNPIPESEFSKLGTVKGLSKKEAVAEAVSMGYDGIESSKLVVAFDPTQIKSADPITRDNSGNVIPLSQRFQQSSADIRYMPETISRDIGSNKDFANPPTDAEAIDALSAEKKAKFGKAARSIKPGTQVAARIDIPAFLRKGKYVVAVHEPDGPSGGPGKVIGYDTVVRLQNPKFVVKPGVQRIYEGKANKFPVATVDGQIMADRSIPSDLEAYVPVGMDPKEHAYFYDKRTDQPVVGGSESVSVGNTVFVKNPVYGDPSRFAFMPTPDSSMPGAYSFQGGFRALPGKEKGKLRIYGPAGNLIGIAASLDQAERMIQKKAKQ